jgi:DNA-binding SARP family transcriptional activator
MRTCHRAVGPVWVRLVGPLHVRRRDQPLAAPAVGNRKARTVLALLAVRYGSWVDLASFVDALWAGGWPRDPGANVATLVSRLRAALGSDVIVGGRGSYRLGERVGTDLDDARALVARATAALAHGTPQDAGPAARHALALLGAGPVLADLPDAGWAAPARTSHAVLLRQARLATVTAALQAGDLTAARLGAVAATAADPFDEAAFRVLMRTYVASGEPVKALLAYQDLRVTLARELGVDPAPDTTRLHVAILRGRTEQVAEPFAVPELAGARQ